jgi:hypothetical protein
MLERCWPAEGVTRVPYWVNRDEPRYEERVVICDSRRFDTLLAIPR